MAKLRHIALIVPDPEKAAKFFEEAFDMKIAGRARRGVYVSDGTINVALLKQEAGREDRHLSFRHVGGRPRRGREEGGGRRRQVSRRPSGAQGAGAPANAHSYYEAKYKDPNGIVFDLTHTGWIGAVKDVVAKN